MATEQTRKRRKNYWVGPRRRIRLLRHLRDVAADAEFISAEIGRTQLAPDDPAEILRLLAEAERHIEKIRAKVAKKVTA